jgi:hypothetical protein
MNDESRFNSSFNQAVRQALDESTERLPWRVTHRLEQAREAALARLPADEVRSPAAGPAQRLMQPAHVGRAGPGSGGSSDSGAAAPGRPSSPYAAVLGAIRRATRGATTTDFAPDGRARPGLAWRLAVVAVPMVVVVTGLLSFSELASERSANEVAELEAAVLADEVPISAYADRGFGAYLKTSYQPER